MDYDKTDMAAVYDAGRGYAPDVLAFWLEEIARRVPEQSVQAILDLGCGTGRYSNALAERFNADVTAVDPSETMLAQSRAKGAPRVRFLEGAAEAIPLPDQSVDLVFISMAFHHFKDHARALLECRRVLKAGGHVFLRCSTREQVGTYPNLPFFPRAREILERTMWPKTRIEGQFSRAGLKPLLHEVVASHTARSWSEYADRIALRADSILVQLSDDEFQEGMRALRDFAAARPAEEPVIERVDVFVFRK